MGKSGADSFTIPVAHSASNSNNVTVELKKGTWTFSAIAWDGVTNEFEGSALCDVKTVEIKNDSETVNLSLSGTKCAATNWGAAAFRSAEFNDLKVVTCGWLYTNAAGNLRVNSSTPDSYCNTGSPLPPERKTYATSVKIEIPQIVNGVTSPGLSECVSSPTDGVFSSGKRIPTAGLPLKIKLFDVLGCDESNLRNIRGDYDFPNGLAGVQTDQQTVLNAVSGTNIFLPTNSIRRGFSDFIAILPQVKCTVPSDGHCGGMPTSIAAGADRIIDSNREFVLVENPGTFTCADIVSTPTDFGGTLTGCRLKDGKILATLSFSPFFGSGTINVNWSDSSSSPVSVINNATYRAYELLFTAVGYPYSPTDVPSNIQNSFPDLFEDSRSIDHGLLSFARDMFEVDNAAGALGTVSCASGYTKEKIVSVYEDEGWETYRVIFRDSDQTVSPREADGTMTSGTPYEKKIIFQMKDDTMVFRTMLTVDFFCSTVYQIGVLEAHETDDDGTERLTKLYWNTQVAGSAKLTAYLSETKKTGATIDEFRSHKLVVNNNAGPNKTYIRSYTLSLEHQGSNMYKYIPVKSQIYLESNIMRYVQAADSSIPNLSGVADTSNFSNINGLPAAIDSCIDRRGTTFVDVAASFCTPLDSNFAPTSWGDLLPGSIESAADAIPAATFEGVQ